MNTANEMNKSGSKSCNTMSKEEKARMTWEALKNKRMVFCGKQAVLIAENQVTGLMVFVDYYEANQYRGERFASFVFAGKRTKPDWSYMFATEAERQKHIHSCIASVEASHKRKEQEREKAAALRAAGHQLIVGDVLLTNWGYEQTNIEYYQVTKLIGKCMVEICEIARIREETGYLQGSCMPAKGQFVGEPMRRRVCTDGKSVKIEDWGIWADKLEPKKVAGLDVYPVNKYSAYA